VRASASSTRTSTSDCGWSFRGLSRTVRSNSPGPTTGPVVTPAPWNDTRPLAKPPRPWSESDFQRDSRRATTAGIQVGALDENGVDTQFKDVWLAHAEQGRDVVGETVQQQHEEKLAFARANVDGYLEAARSRESQQAVAANEAKMTQAVRELYQSRLARNRGDNTDPARVRQDLQQLADRAANGHMT
jgi:hypothetical protein